jgi:hypothetical protein
MDDVWDDDDNGNDNDNKIPRAVDTSTSQPFHKDLEKLEEIHSNVTPPPKSSTNCVTGRLQGRNNSRTIQVSARGI